MNTNSLTNAVKRTLAGVSALVMLASAASCSAAAPSGSSGSANSPQTNNGGDAKQPDAGSDVAQIKQAGNNYTYDSADIEGIPAMTNINQVFTCPGSDKVYLVSYNEEGKISLCQTT